MERNVLIKIEKEICIYFYGTVNSFAQIFSCSIDMAAQCP